VSHEVLRCDSSLNSGVGIDGTLVLAAHTFWDTSKFGAYWGPKVLSLIGSMEPMLKNSALTSRCSGASSFVGPYMSRTTSLRAHL